MNKERVKKVLEEMENQGIDQLLVTDPTSIYYLTGHFENPWERFWAFYVNRDGSYRVIANRLFSLTEIDDADILWYSDGESAVEKFRPLVDGAQTFSVDGTMAAKFLLEMMEKKVAAGYRDGSEVMKRVRACKDSHEQEKMADVSEINDAAMTEFQKLIREGVTELDIADAMLKIYKSLGADGYSFEPLIAFGANAALGHHAPDKTVLKKGDCVLLDVGCKKDGYCADMTRTFFFGEPDEESRKVYETVLAAQKAAEAVIRPGIALKEVDKVARDIITEAGYGAYFTHRLGHFIGYDVHEDGDVSPTTDIIARPGMVFSIEPGAYLPGKVGVRIEDLVIVTEDGVRILNHYPKELQVIS